MKKTKTITVTCDRCEKEVDQHIEVTGEITLEVGKHGRRWN